MSDSTPATPASAATPGTVPASAPNVSPNGAPAAEPGTTPQGTVIISTKEFAQLNRDAARGRSPKRGSSTPSGVQIPEGADDNIAQAIRTATEGQAKAELKVMQLEVQGKVRDLLAKDDFKGLPEATKKRIIEKPHLLTDADNLDDALFDIEDYARDLLVDFAPATVPVPGTPAATQPEGHQAPPTVGSGAPAPTAAAQLEDISKLTGPAKTQAMIRNQMKTGKKQV